jgi:hypothetical protein
LCAFPSELKRLFSQASALTPDKTRTRLEQDPNIKPDMDRFENFEKPLFAPPPVDFKKSAEFIEAIAF